MNKRKAETIASVTALKTLLENLLNKRSELPEEHISSLKPFLVSQGALAKYANSALGIRGNSLNTLKRISDDYIEGGFRSFDILRKAALNSLNQSKLDKKPLKRSSKASLEERIDKSSQVIDQLRGDLLLLTWVLEKSLEHSRAYAADATEPVRIRCKKEQRELLDMLTLRKTPKSAEVIKLYGR